MTQPGDHDRSKDDEMHYADHGVAGGFPHPASACAAPAYESQTFTICACPQCGMFLGFPGWNPKCPNHATRGDRIKVRQIGGTDG